MERPLAIGVTAYRVELFRVALVWPPIGQMLTFLGVTGCSRHGRAGRGVIDGRWWPAAGQIHSDGRVSALRPKPDPFGEGGSSAAVNQDHSGELCFPVSLSQRPG